MMSEEDKTEQKQNYIWCFWSNTFALKRKQPNTPSWVYTHNPKAHYHLAGSVVWVRSAINYTFKIYQSILLEIIIQDLQ